MSARAKAGAPAAALLLVLGALVGCGGGGDEGSSTSSSSSTPSVSSTSSEAKQKSKAKQNKSKAKDSSSQELPDPGPPASAFKPKPHRDSGGGSEQFSVKGGDNSVQEYGQEGSDAELQAAAAALHGFLDARVEGNWAAACTYLSKSVSEGFQQLASQARQIGKQLDGADCAAVLATLSDVPRSNLREAAIADVASLRAEGDRAFIIYRGPPKGAVYAVAVVKESGEWKVASPSGIPLT